MVGNLVSPVPSSMDTKAMMLFLFLCLMTEVVMFLVLLSEPSYSWEPP